MVLHFLPKFLTILASLRKGRALEGQTVIEEKSVMLGTVGCRCVPNAYAETPLSSKVTFRGGAFER